MELWNIYDKYRHMTEKVHERGVPIAEGDFHIVVHVWIVNDKGEILIQRRQPWKRGWPNMWDCAAAGAAVLGDSSRDAALREAKEELGIDLDLNRGQLLFTAKFERGFDDIWLVRQNIDASDLRLQYEEVAEAKWSNESEIREMIRRGEFIDFNYVDALFKVLNSEISLARADVCEAEVLLELQKEVFKPIYEKYQDHDTSPVNQTRDKFLRKFELGDYYKVLYKDNLAGSVFVYEKAPGVMRLHIINILEEYQNRGIAQEVIWRLELLYPQAESWLLETILTEQRNCHVYEKMGYKRNGELKAINDRLTLVGYVKDNPSRLQEI
ncbi:MAG: bifunctional NUDIX hydrolase family protein/GNAT family N-acetyltransferase [Bacillota bacterium]|nr:bifunctional NUDIX hydrolase family protein/GNAT family N-acetyltransferase [Bacillota bacterium]